MNWTGYGRAEQVWGATAAVLAILFVATLALAAWDRRLLDGAPVWAKPLKFELSLAIHFATLALAASALGDAWRRSSLVDILAWLSVACAAFEILYIAVQAARQQASHFNLSTPLHAALYTGMAIGAVVITAAAGIVAIGVVVDPRATVGTATRWGLVLGLGLGTLLTFVTAFRMGGALGHHVGIEPAGAPRVPVTGWSLAVGDRRVPHFLATHMMQAVPLAGLLLDRWLARGPALAAVLAVAAAWTLLTLLSFRQANAGLPLLRWPA